MNLLNKLFDSDKYEVIKINKKSVLLLIITCLLIMFLLFFVKKDNYYINNFTNIDGEIILLIDKDYINTIKNKRKILINDIEFDYSINSIIPVEKKYMLNIKLNNKIDNIKTGKYKVLLGKENLFDYIFRILKK